MPVDEKLSEYDKVITKIFFKKFNKSLRELEFTKDELVDAMKELAINVRNVPDVIYTYRSRAVLPKSILEKGNWIIKPKGKGKFSFVKSKRSPFVDIQVDSVPIEIPNALPEIVEKHASADEQALLSSIRYNRLVDIFTEITCFHLQSHIRTTVKGEGQIEVDDLYVGIDAEGTEYVLPLEAKSPDDRDKLGWIQVSNMVKYATQNFPSLRCRAIAAKPARANEIHLVEFSNNTDHEEIGIVQERRYKLIRQGRTA